jgi:hypothetical protein
MPVANNETQGSPPGFERPDLVRVLESAAALQEVVPDAVLVGDSAAADHRSSYDHDHVVADLAERFDAVLGAVEETNGWVTNRAVPGKIILGDLGGIESGIRQMIRRTPLEVTEIVLPSGHRLRVPTPDEILRIKGFLVVRRNQTRDYLDVVALADRYGIVHAGDVLGDVDRYYEDQRGPGSTGVATQLARQLADPRPADCRTVDRDRRLSGAGSGDGPVSTGLAFRNVDASPDDAVETWPFEAVVAAVERGFLADWRRLARAIAADPWGPVAEAVDDAVGLSHPYGTTELFHAVIARARRDATDDERREVAAEIGQLLASSGLSRQAFASRIGTSTSRLSTYLTGKVTPSAALMVRMRRVAEDA